MTGLDIEGVLYDHREGALTCYDHDGLGVWCCVCGAHRLTTTHRAHVAAALAEQLDAELAEMNQKCREDGAEQERASIAKELARLTSDREVIAYADGLVRGYQLTQEGPQEGPEE